VSPCDHVDLGGGQFAIICSRGNTKRCKCGRKSTKLCDWKLHGPKEGKTCDEPLCDGCAVNVAPEKDLCQPHNRMWERMKAEKAK
jgi:hypothetical protein